jgi:hypothetical protein
MLLVLVLAEFVGPITGNLFPPLCSNHFTLRKYVKIAL